MLEYLIDNKINLNIQDENGKTALHFAFENLATLDHRIALLLINEKTDFSLRDNEGNAYVTNIYFKDFM
jgi:ankyrin repeat protein